MTFLIRCLPHSPGSFVGQDILIVFKNMCILLFMVPSEGERQRFTMQLVLKGELEVVFY